MTSKKALQKLFSLTHCNGCKNNLKCINENLCYTYLTIINQDLKRLEMLENAIKIINDALELYVIDDEIGVENRSSFIDYEDSELVKEVLNYE